MSFFLGALQNVMHQLWRPLATRAIAMPFRVELGCDIRYRWPLALARFPPKLPHVLDQVLLGRKVTVRLHAFDAFTSGALTFTCSAQLQDRHSLVKFTDCSEHLANQAARRVVPVGAAQEHAAAHASDDFMRTAVLMLLRALQVQ